MPTTQTPQKPALSIPISTSKSAALSRILDCVPKGYTHYCKGTIQAGKLASLIRKFHDCYGICCTPAQRITRKKHGKANCLLVVFQPEAVEVAEWLLLATKGSGLEVERMASVLEKPRLTWLGYELARYPNRGKTSWTWKRAKTEVTELYELLATWLNRKNPTQLQTALQRIANQPGFHGVREQSKELFAFARSRGYDGGFPMLFYLQKVPHGESRAIPNK
jgi:hypothetical protein